MNHETLKYKRYLLKIKQHATDRGEIKQNRSLIDRATLPTVLPKNQEKKRDNARSTFACYDIRHIDFEFWMISLVNLVLLN